MTPPAVPVLQVLTQPDCQHTNEEIDRVVTAGAPFIQVRMKGVGDRTLLAYATRVRALTAGRSLLGMNDRVDIALAVGADAVHLGEDDLPPAIVRRLGGATLVSASCHDVPSALAVQDDVHYLGFGPVWDTTSKPDAPDGFGLEELRKVVEAVSVPVIAIGGVTLDRVADVMAAGASGVAVIGAVWRAPDAGDAVRRLLGALHG